MTRKYFTRLYNILIAINCKEIDPEKIDKCYKETCNKLFETNGWLKVSASYHKVAHGSEIIINSPVALGLMGEGPGEEPAEFNIEFLNLIVNTMPKK